MVTDEKTIDEIVKKTVAAVLENSEDEKMTLKLARKISFKVIEKARSIGVRAVCAVADASARVVVTECDDDSFIASTDIAISKAYTSAALKMNTKELKKLAQPGGELYGIQNTNGGKIVIFGGGNVLKKGDKVIGAVGVSGGTEEQDTYLGDFAQSVFAEEFV